MHELCRAEILVGIKELLASQFALTILVVAILIPCRVRGIGILAEVIGRVGDNQLGVRYAVHLEVLKVVVKQFYLIHNNYSFSFSNWRMRSLQMWMIFS